VEQFVIFSPLLGKTLALLATLARDKRSYQPIVNYGRKKFNNVGPTLFGYSRKLGIKNIIVK
jgi:hypothetical protein